MRRLSSLPVALTAAAVAVLAAAVPATAAPAHRSTVPTETLRASVFGHLSNATRTGDVPADQRMYVAVGLQQDTAAIDAFNATVYDPNSSNYHHFLTAGEAAAKFAIPASRVSAVESWVTRDGLTVDHTSSTGDVIFLTGTAKEAGTTFGTTLGDFSYKGRTFFANDTSLTVPAGDGVIGVIGLNNVFRSTTFATTGTDHSDHTAHAAQGTCAGSTCTGLTTPQDIWSAYDEPSADSANGKANFGEGQKMAIFGEGETDSVVSDLRSFETLNNLLRIPIKVIHTDGPNADYTDSSGSEEWDIDTQSSTGMSPDALEEDLYFGHDLSDASTLSTLSNWINDGNGPLQASASYGECELNATSPIGAPGTSAGGVAGSESAQNTQEYEAQLKVGLSMGRTLFASTGDTGSSCPVVVAAGIGAGNGVANQGFPVVNYPASSPEVVAVGGTVLYTDSDAAAGDASTAKRVLEYSWTYTGGGSSGVFDEPSYQQGISTIVQKCDLDATGAPRTTLTTTCRGIPDIAAQSGDVATNGYAIVANGTPDSAGGGTSLSSPMSMGMWTRIQAAAPLVNGKASGLGFADTSYYKVGQDPTEDPGAFFDIGGTTNSQPGTSANTGNGEYVPLPRSQVDPSGWDYTSGLGVPDIAVLMKDLDGTTTPTDDVLPVEPPANTSGSGATVYPACIPLFTDPEGDDAYVGDAAGGSNPQLDIVQGDMHLVPAASAPSHKDSIETVLTIASLSTDMASAAGAANIYYVTWSYKGTTYFTEAEVDSATKAITYGDGTFAMNEYTAGTGTGDTGSFNTGPDGTVVVIVPLANVGDSAPSGADQLLAPAGSTRVLVGTSETGGLVEQADTASDDAQTFTLGETCPGNGLPGTDADPTYMPGPMVSESPLAVGLPVLGLVLAGAAAYAVRRRRFTP